MNLHKLSTDIVVAGGGAAGVPCALAAARCGAKVVLIHDRPVLGGNASSEIRMHICGADCSGGRGEPLKTETREGGIIEEVKLDTCVNNPQRSASMLDLVFYDKCRTEPNLTLMLNTSVVGAEVTDGEISRVTADRQSTEDRFEIAARVFIDCTGDGRLGAEAGALFRHGREDKEEFGEDMAPDEADNKTLGSSLLFMARKHDRAIPFRAPSWARKFTEHDLRLRHHDGFEYGYWWVEWGGCLNTIKDNEQIRDELLAIFLGVWDHIKNGGDHSADNWALEWFSFVPGKRESRRFVGQYMLCESDLVESRAFEDAIAYGGWSLDLHPVEGIDATDEHPCHQKGLKHIYDIPLRSCISKNVPNLMFAGRNISASHVAFGSTRVMATCAAMGQGVGTAAAYAVRHGRKPADLTSDNQAVQAIQQRLLRDDAYLIGRINMDPADIARNARAVASSAQPGGAASNVTSAVTRAVHGPKGAPRDRAVPGTHRWMSKPGAGFPAWVELRWDRAIRPVEIQLVFDTGMHRPLTLTHVNSYATRMKWGEPQPETVRDYRIEGIAGDGSRQLLAEVKGNYQRRRVHKLDSPVPVKAVRVTVDATNGLDHARICEVRVKS